MKFITSEISQHACISLMSQYTPYYKASRLKDISRRITDEEYEASQEAMQRHGLYNGWIQESYGLERFAGIHIKSNIKIKYQIYKSKIKYSGSMDHNSSKLVDRIC